MRLGNWKLKTVATLGLLLLALPVFSQEPNLSINLSLTVIEGEHSRDSNSTTTTITIKGNHLVYARSYSGYRDKQRQPIHKETVIKNEDMKKLRELISSRKFFDSAS